MLQSIRDGSQGWITWVIVGLISITFIAIGTTSYMSGPSDDVVAVVQGRKIKKSEVDKLAKRIASQNTTVDPQSIDLKKVKIEALRALTENTILVNAAKKQGFKVSTQQVAAFLNSVPDFQEKGQFSPQKYKNILMQIEYTDLEFRNEIENALLIDQVRQSFKNTSFKMPQDLLKAVNFENQKRDFDFVLIQNSMFNKEVNISNAEIETYYKAHLNQFLTDEKVKVEYLELKLKDASLEEEAFAKKADELIQLTYDHSDSLLPAADKLELSAQQSPWLAKNNPAQVGAPFNNPKVLAAAFSDEVLGHMNSDVMQLDPKHYIVLRLAEHQKPKQKPLAEVKVQIEKILTEQAAAKQAHQFASKVLAEIKKGNNYKNLEALKKYNLGWESVQAVARNNQSMPSKLLEEAFRLPKPVQNKVTANAVALTQEYRAIIILNKVVDGQLVDLDSENKNSLGMQLEKYAAQLEFELFAKDALQKAVAIK